MEKRTFFFPSADGLHSCHALMWRPAGPPRGVVQLVHGIAEHVGRYSREAEFFAQAGYVVCGADHLGHGGTAREGELGFFAPQGGWELVVEDIHTLALKLEEKFPGVPHILLGHSMGSFLVRTYLIDHPGQVQGAVLSGTGQENAALVALGRLMAALECRRLGPKGISPLVTALSLGAYNRRFAPNRTGADWVSSDPKEVDAYLADPLCTFVPTVSLFRDMLGALARLGRQKNLAPMDPNTPIYLFSGQRDPVGQMGRGVERVADMLRRAGCREVEVRLYPDGRHEMFHEIQREEVLSDTLRWLDRHCPPESRKEIRSHEQMV